MNIYEETYEDKRNFLEDSKLEQMRDNISRNPTFSLENKDDYESAKMVNWLFQEEDYKNGYYFSNELARKYLVEGRSDLAKKTLDQRNDFKGSSKA